MCNEHTNIQEMLDKYFHDKSRSTDVWYEGETFEVVNGRVNISRQFCALKKSTIINKIPIPFGSVSNNFYCDDNQLTTLENAPLAVGIQGIGHFVCSTNLITNLRFMPKKITGTFISRNNRLTSLEGIEIDSDLYNGVLDYYSDLPLLRLLLFKGSIEFNSGDSSSNINRLRLENIINKYISDKSMPLYEKQMRCQHELLGHPEYRMNAEW